MTVISNYVDGIKTFGEAEAIVEHYAELSNDPKGKNSSFSKEKTNTINNNIGNLPEVFAICSSFLIKHVTTDLYFFQTYTVWYDQVQSNFHISVSYY